MSGRICVGDASQPLHVSVHHDGWGKFPDPEGLAAQAGIHGKFEGSFVQANFREADIAPLLPPVRPCNCKIEDETAAYLGRSHALVLPLYRMDKDGDFEGANPQGKAFVAERLAAGAAELRDLMTEAWTESDTISVGYPAFPVKNAESGHADMAAILGSLQGLD